MTVATNSRAQKQIIAEVSGSKITVLFVPKGIKVIICSYKRALKSFQQISF